MEEKPILHINYLYLITTKKINDVVLSRNRRTCSSITSSRMLTISYLRLEGGKLLGIVERLQALKIQSTGNSTITYAKLEKNSTLEEFVRNM